MSRFNFFLEYRILYSSILIGFYNFYFSSAVDIVDILKYVLMPDKYSCIL